MTDIAHGLEGVVAFETTIAEPDRDGGALRYRGVDIEDLAGRVSFGDVWQLLVDGEFGRGLPATGPALLPVRTGNVRVDAQAAIAMLACARLGAVHSVVFGGFAANELAVRIDDAQPTACDRDTSFPRSGAGLRVYAKSTNLPKVLGGLGVAILSTSSGLLTDKQAAKKGVGGEVLAYVW